MAGRYCGSEIPHPVTSFSNSMVVNFISDNSVSRKGFRAIYAASTSSILRHTAHSPGCTQQLKLKVIMMSNIIMYSQDLENFLLLISFIQIVEEIWWCRMGHLTVPTIQILIHQIWNVCGPSGAHQETVSSSHLC